MTVSADVQARDETLPRRADRPSAAAIIRAIIAKDSLAFRRNRFLMLITFLVLIAWALIYQFLPKTVDETFSVGIVVEQGALPPGIALDPAALSAQDEIGVAVRLYGDIGSLEQAVDAGDDVAAGLRIPAGFAAAVAAGAPTSITVVLPAGLPEQYRTLLESSAAEIGYLISGSEAPIDLATDTTIVGTDRIGAQISLAEQMRPLLLIVVLLVEVFALATLVAGEIAERTATAVLATPASAAHLITAKMIFGTLLAFGEAVFLGLLIGAFANSGAMILIALFLGAVVVTGLGLLAGSFGRDFMDTLIMGMLVMFPLMVPAIAALFPGSAPTWVTVLPTYGLVEVVVGASAGTLNWSAAAVPLLTLAGWGVVLGLVGVFALNRRVARL